MMMLSHRMLWDDQNEFPSLRVTSLPSALRAMQDEGKTRSCCRPGLTHPPSFLLFFPSRPVCGSMQGPEDEFVFLLCLSIPAVTQISSIRVTNPRALIPIPLQGFPLSSPASFLFSSTHAFKPHSLSHVIVASSHLFSCKITEP